MTVAILGAGIQGALSALALAQKGKGSCLYDVQTSPMTRASRWNEGKIHLGYIFANDPSLQTARLMIEGALSFQNIVETLSGIKLEDKLVSTSSFVLGPFGDVVSFSDSHYYFSWYPVGCQRRSNELIPPAWEKSLSQKERMSIVAESMLRLSSLIPDMKNMQLNPERTRVEGGYIFTWGKNDICDLESEIHQRFKVGMQSSENYHSIDTGKYTTAPLFAKQIAERICGEK